MQRFVQIPMHGHELGAPLGKVNTLGGLRSMSQPRDDPVVLAGKKMKGMLLVVGDLSPHMQLVINMSRYLARCLEPVIISRPRAEMLALENLNHSCKRPE